MACEISEKYTAINKYQGMGVYAIVNVFNGKRYVGSSLNVSKRIWAHKSYLRSNNHHSSYLQNSYNKYGENSFLYLLIEKFDSEEDMRKAEEKYINERGEFNAVTSVDPSCLGEANRKPVVQYSLDRDLIAEFHSITEASKQTGIPAGGIGEACNNTKGAMSSGGFLWIFKGDELKEYAPWSCISTKVDQFDLNGNFIQTFHSIAKASKQTGAHRLVIGKCLKTNKNPNIKNPAYTTGGFRWAEHGEKPIEYKKNKGAPVYQFDLDGNFIAKHDSAREAADLLKIHVNTITHCIRGTNKSGAGFIWRNEKGDKDAV